VAVYTEPTDEELEALMARYDLGRPLSFKGIAEGVENSNFLLETEAGRHFLTIYEKRVNPHDLPFFMALMEHLGAAGFPSPRPLKTKDGGLLAEVRGKPAAIITFLKGVSPHRPDAAQCRAVGAALAKLHGALASFPQTRPNTLGPTAWAPLIEPKLKLAEELRLGLAVQLELDLALVTDSRSDLPRGVIHADLFPDNALFIGDEISGVIDFYFACTDALAYDLAVCLNAWCFETGSQYNITKGQALIAGYESVRALSEAERAALPALARGAALRFFATRLHDWAETPAGALVKPKNPLEYADKLEFHRRAVSAADYGG
jgi:homoserine kinase type II